MGFDDTKTEPVIVVGCLAVICGLAAPAIGHLFGWWWSLALLAPPIVVWVLLGWAWRLAFGEGDQANGEPDP
jgi:hypothetical protein